MSLCSGGGGGGGERRRGSEGIYENWSNPRAHAIFQSARVPYRDDVSCLGTCPGNTLLSRNVYEGCGSPKTRMRKADIKEQKITNIRREIVVRDQIPRAIDVFRIKGNLHTYIRETRMYSAEAPEPSNEIVADARVEKSSNFQVDARGYTTHTRRHIHAGGRVEHEYFIKVSVF